MRTPVSAADMRDRLGRFVVGADELLVLDVSGVDHAHLGFSTKAGRWLDDHI